MRTENAMVGEQTDRGMWKEEEKEEDVVVFLALNYRYIFNST